MSEAYQKVVQKEFQDFILAHENEDERSLVLKNKSILGVSSAIVADQIAGRRKAKTKLPDLYSMAGVVYPPSINVEQCSSQFTATFKAGLLANGTRPYRGVDLTGGFGIDSLYISRMCNELEFVEPNVALLEMAQHNHVLLGATNIRYHPVTAEVFLKSATQHFDFIFMDPSRRSGSKKVFRLSDCQPNPVQLLPAIFEKTNRLLLKASPLLDLQQGTMELKGVEAIFVLAVDGECKEVVFVCTQAGRVEPSVTAINLPAPYRHSATEEFAFTFSEEKNAASVISDPLLYLYEPPAWMLKAGAFKLTGSRYQLSKLHVNTHLYTSDQFVEKFPGKVFKVDGLKLDGRKIKVYFPEGKANVITRNYPLTPEQVRKKYRISDGGEGYIIGFSGARQKFLVAATRLK